MGLISRKLCRFLLIFSTGFTSLSVLLLFPTLINFFVFVHGFDSISSNLDQVPSINPSAVVLFGDFNIHHKDWLTYSSGTDRSDELCYNFSISNNLTQMVSFPTGTQTVVLTVLLSWIYLFLLMLVFVLQWFYLHWEILIMLLSQFPLTFHHIHNRMPRFITLLMTILMVCMILWEMFHGRISLNSAPASEFCEWVQVGIDVYIPHWKYQVKPHSSPWFSAACAAAIVHRNHFFRLYQKDEPYESNVKFRQANNHCKRVFEAAKLTHANKTNESITSQNIGSGTFGELPIVFSTKVNLLYLNVLNLYSTAQRCCLLHLIKQNCLLKTFLRILILITQVSLYLF